MDILKDLNEVVEGVYLKLEPDSELSKSDAPYEVTVLVVVAGEVGDSADWAIERDKVEKPIRTFWESRKHDGIRCIEVLVRTSDRVTLKELTVFSRLDVDWLSAEYEDSAAQPIDSTLIP